MARNENKKVLQQLSEAYEKVLKESSWDLSGGWTSARDWAGEIEDKEEALRLKLRDKKVEKTQQKFKIFFTTALNPDFADAEGWISYGTDKEDAWDNLHTYFKNIPRGPGHRGRNLMSFWHVQIEPYEEGDPCADAMGPCQDITAEENEEHDEPKRGITGREYKTDAFVAARQAGAIHKPYVSSFVSDGGKIFGVIGSDGKIVHKTRDKQKAYQWLKANYDNI